MNQNFPIHSAQFFTATIYQWNHLLSNDRHKDIIADSLKFLVTNKRIELNAFVIMSNHIHLIWQPLMGFSPSDIQAFFMKYTAQQLKRSLTKNNLVHHGIAAVWSPDQRLHIKTSPPANQQFPSIFILDQQLVFNREDLNKRQGIFLLR